MKNWKNKWGSKEWIILSTGSLVAFLAVSVFDVFEVIWQLSRKYEKYRFDEIFILMMILTVTGGVFFILRGKRLSVEIARRKRAGEALKKLLPKLDQMVHENAAMAEIGRIISSSLNINEVYKSFAAEANKIIPFDRIAIITVDLEHETFLNAYIEGLDTPGRRSGDIVPLAGSLTERIISTGSGLIVHPEGIDELADRFPGLVPSFKAGARSFLMVPLISGNSTVGVLHFSSTTPGIYTEMNLALAKRVGNQIAGAITNAQLYIQRKRMEEDKARLIEELREKNNELEASIRQLEETTMQVVQLEKISALGELTAGVAHELNQPLNGIKIICQSLLRDIERNRFEEEELMGDLSEIVGQVNKMAEIIDHMRIYTRNSVGRLEEEIDVNTVVEGPFKLLGQQLKTHNIEITKELSPDLPKPLGNLIRLEQVFMNLINNAKSAVDASGKDNKRIGIRTYQMGNNGSPGEHPVVVVEVKDNGIGIPENIINKVFQPFFTTKEPGKGTGLGLSVSGRIVEEHKGKIELDSIVGEGTTVRVILPVGNEL